MQVRVKSLSGDGVDRIGELVTVSFVPRQVMKIVRGQMVETVVMEATAVVASEGEFLIGSLGDMEPLPELEILPLVLPRLEDRA